MTEIPWSALEVLSYSPGQMGCNSIATKGGMRDEGPHETGSGVVGVMGRVQGTGAPVRGVGEVLFEKNGEPK